MKNLRRLMKLTICSTILIIALGKTAAGSERSGQKLVLVDKGRPAATIVIAENATSWAEFAAGELQYHVKKITGAELPVVTDTGRVPGTRILIGESAATREMGLFNRDFKNQEYLIRFLPDTLVLMGKDKTEQPLMKGIPGKAAGKYGQALSFDGGTGLSIAGCKFNDAEGTMEAWVWMPAEPQEGAGTILRIDGTNPWTYHIIQRHPKNSTIEYLTYRKESPASFAGVTSGNLAEGWHHLMGTYSGKENRMELFIDGVSQGTAKYARTTCKGTKLNVGGIAPQKAGDPAGNAFVGLIDEIRISDIVRPSDKIGTGGPYTPDANTILLLHFDDDSEFGSMSSGTRRKTGIQFNPFAEQGTCYAVYDFLERFCSVRWYLPTELGLVCPHNNTLAVEGTEIRRSPAMKYRFFSCADNFTADLCGDTIKSAVPPPGLEWREAVLFLRRQRVGGEPYAACHSLSGYWDRFREKNPKKPDLFECEHPDWFAQGYPGTPGQMCYTNPEFIRQVVQDARDYFDGKGLKPGAHAMGDYFAVVPRDNDRWCKCPNCQALLKEEPSRGKGMFSNDRVSNYIFAFVNRVAREVKKTHPDKYICTLAYSDYAYPSTIERLEPNVSIQLCLQNRMIYSPSLQANDETIVKEWTAEPENRPVYLWLYYCFPSLNALWGQYRCFPGFFAHTLVKQIKGYYGAGVKGIFVEPSYVAHNRRSILLDQVESHITLKLTDDPSLDGDKLIDTFFTSYYGGAAKPMREMYERMEKIFADPANYPDGYTGHQTEEIAWGRLGTRTRMDELGKLMELAVSSAGTDIEKQRVALFKKGVWDYMLAGRAAYLEHSIVKAETMQSARVPYMTGPLNGDLSKVDWSKAGVLSGWRSLKGETADHEIETRIVYDGKWLYLQMTERTDPKKLAVNQKEIWKGDDWEIFIARQRSRPYRQMVIDSRGVHLDLAYGEGSEQWDSGAAVISDTSLPDHWTVQAALPLESLLQGGVKPGEKIYLNILRSIAGKGALAWIPTFGGYHEPERLGEILLAPEGTKERGRK